MIKFTLKTNTPPPPPRSWIRTDLFSQSDWFQTTFSSRTVPFLAQPPKSCTCRVSMILLRLINRMEGVQSLICPLRGAITVHCEEPHAFEDNIWYELRLMHSLCVSPPPQHQHCTHSLINTDAQCTCMSVRVGAADGSSWPHLEIRGEPLH